MTPRVAAHRGWSARFPENTQAAFAAARLPGVAAVEFDVQLSRDGEPVVVHDRTLERFGQGMRRVAERDLVDLRGVDVGSPLDPAHGPARIPRLEEVLDILHDRELWIEIKVYPGDVESGRAERTLTCVEKAVALRDAEERTRILCFHRPTLSATDLPSVWNLAAPVACDSLHGLFAVDMDVDALTPQFARTARRAGLGLMCYTVNTDAQLRHAISCGVDAVICDDPAWAVRALGQS